MNEYNVIENGNKKTGSWYGFTPLSVVGDVLAYAEDVLGKIKTDLDYPKHSLVLMVLEQHYHQMEQMDHVDLEQIYKA